MKTEKTSTANTAEDKMDAANLKSLRAAYRNRKRVVTTKKAAKKSVIKATMH
jgi:hypothetical protein